ncbi:pentatricopeptide repeat-containing protein At2g35030, mitochondrial [Selaginella moellendorffii]|uniref:pentatricopeptide repeat-containing protein At2g35030, mitochondrial n=1 Tax=Selaginella moellendorffii TaxID=88036 RepID=UPI000D1C5FF1|nr:pentatricopeptide repeat-containing protein At2g35030, mitochondrial [Selaginella moellendorffii]|eukprot:XP_024533697.1 pentatricopeptide repeat-containing protein At2g35030, mitochondrial [Selaginella moellendorffii]
MKWRRVWLSRSYSTLLLPEEIHRLRNSLAHADSATFALLLRHCSNARALQQGKLIHSYIIDKGYGQDTFLGNLLVKMYSDCDCIQDAQAVFSSIRHKNVFSWNIMTAAFAQTRDMQKARKCFDQTPRKDAVSWTTMMSAYTQVGKCKEALQLFKLMDLSGVYPDQGAFVSVLNACASEASASERREILEHLEAGVSDLDVVLGTSMVGIYGKSGEIDKARAVFRQMPKRNVVSWTVMVEATVEDGNLQRARELFEKMPEWTTASWVVVISAYARLGELLEAESLLDRMLYQNVAAWTVVIAANAHMGHVQEAAFLFQRMDQAGVPPDKITLVNILDGCAKFGALAIAKTIESGIADTEFMKDDAVVTNLINVHGKCSSVKHAIELFEGEAFLLDSVILWSSTMAALAQNDRAREAIELFHCLQLYGMEPTRITFSIVLFVCSHGGMMKRGWESFLAMQADHFLNPDVDHFVSMIDLLGRCGWLDLAFELIETMPFVPDDVAWTILLNTSKLYDESTRARLAAKHLMELGDEDSAPYVLLAGVCRSSSPQQDEELFPHSLSL